MSPKNNIEIFQGDDGQTQIEIRLDEGTLWLSQAQMAEWFDKDSDTIGLHLRNIFKEDELNENSTTEESLVVRQEGKRQVRRNIRFCNLDVAISVEFRVIPKKVPNSACGPHSGYGTIWSMVMRSINNVFSKMPQNSSRLWNSSGKRHRAPNCVRWKGAVWSRSSVAIPRPSSGCKNTTKVCSTTPKAILVGICRHRMLRCEHWKSLTPVLHEISSPEAFRAVYQCRRRPREIQEK